jgi:hypothetical protein
MPSYPVATWIVRLVGLYLLIGMAFAVAFALRWAGRLDSVASQGTWGFRLLLLPGATLLWPVLAGRVATAGRDARSHADARPHDDARPHPRDTR